MSLRSLTISYIGFTEQSKPQRNELLLSLAQAINQQKLLKELILDSNEESIEFINEVILNNRTVTDLYLRICELKDSGLILLHGALAQNRQLRKLDLQSNGLKSESGAILGITLQSGLRCLKELHLNNNSLTDEGLKPLLRAILETGS